MFFNERIEPRFLPDLKATSYPAFLYTFLNFGEIIGIHGSMIRFFGSSIVSDVIPELIGVYGDLGNLDHIHRTLGSEQKS